MANDKEKLKKVLLTHVHRAFYAKKKDDNSAVQAQNPFGQFSPGTGDLFRRRKDIIKEWAKGRKQLFGLKKVQVKKPKAQKLVFQNKPIQQQKKR